MMGVYMIMASFFIAHIIFICLEESPWANHICSKRSKSRALKIYHRGYENRVKITISYVFVCVYLKMTSAECHNSVKIIKNEWIGTLWIPQTFISSSLLFHDHRVRNKWIMFVAFWKLNWCWKRKRFMIHERNRLKVFVWIGQTLPRPTTTTYPQLGPWVFSWWLGWSGIIFDPNHNRTKITVGW